MMRVSINHYNHYKKSHVGFRLVLKSVTLNDLASNGLMALILLYFTEFGSFGTHYVKVVEDRPILFATKM